jgi:uncharacterized membrane protein
MLVPFPIAFLVGALVTDCVFWATGAPFWARVSHWLIGAGFVMGALAAIAGLIDFLSRESIRALSAAWVHFIGNAIAILLTLWNLIQRTGGDPAAILPLGIILSAIVVAVFLVTGWLGGELVFRYRIGMIEGEPPQPLAHVATPGAEPGTAVLDPSYAGGRGPTSPPRTAP